jgi:hypothetical protein
MICRWPCIVTAVLCCSLVSCATQPPPTPKQVKVETDFTDCIRDLGARGPTLISVSPEGQFKWRAGTGGEVSIAQEKTMIWPQAA